MPFPLIIRLLTLYGPLILRVCRFTTRKYVLGNIGLSLLVELWTFLNKDLRDTISEIIWEFLDQQKYGRLPAFLGAFLFAHWFFQRKPEQLSKSPIFRFLDEYPDTVVFLGLVCGYLVWQRAPGRKGQTQ